MTVPEAIDRVSATLGRISDTLRAMLVEAPPDPEVPPMALALTVRQHGASHNYTATVTHAGYARVTVEVDGVLILECATSPCAVPLTIRTRGVATVAALAYDAAGLLRSAVFEPVAR